VIEEEGLSKDRQESILGELEDTNFNLLSEKSRESLIKKIRDIKEKIIKEGKLKNR
jgi:hypothetical protein